MSLKFQSSIGSKLFTKSEKWWDFFENWKKKELNWTLALQVPRAVTRLTVHRALPYWPTRQIAEPCPREDLWCWTWIFQFNWYFAFELLVLLHSKPLDYIEVSFTEIISVGTLANIGFELAHLFSKRLIFWGIFSKFSENSQKMKTSRGIPKMNSFPSRDTF